MSPARLTIALPTYADEDPGSWGHVLDIARAADDAGIDRVVVSDHVLFGENLEAYSDPASGGIVGGRQPTGPDGCWLEPITLLAAVSACTARVRLGTNILLAALRRPVVLAKQIATLDVLSEGRVDLGVGVGWQREEYEAAGLDFSARGDLLDDALAACQTLWREQRATFESPTVTFSGIHSMPKPVQPDGVPIWVSGRCIPRVARRIARFGRGWIPWGDEAANLNTSIPKMRDAVERAGGDASSLAVYGTLHLRRRSDATVDITETMRGLSQLIEAGVTDVRVNVSVPASYSEAFDTFGELAGAFRDARD